MDGADDDSRFARRELVETLQRAGHLRSPRVIHALLAVPRELFLPGVPREDVYCPSEAIVTKRVDGVSVSSASAPEVVALMLEQLDARPGQRVLEIGAGTGYNAALLAHIVGETGHVVTLDIDEDLVTMARDHLTAAGFDKNVEVIQADGALGYPQPHAYDRIMLTVACNDIAPAWRQQLASPDGRLVMPLGLCGVQRCVAFVSEGDCLVSQSLRNCSFIPMRGLLSIGWPRIALDADGSRVLAGGDGPLPLSPDAIGALLLAPFRVLRTGVAISPEELREGLQLWLVANQPNVYTLWGARDVPDLFQLPERMGARGTLCVMDSSDGLALLAWADEGVRGGELSVLIPPGCEPLAARLQHLLRQWDELDRPSDAQAEIRACSRPAAPPARIGEAVVDQRWTRFTLSWARAARG